MADPTPIDRKFRAIEGGLTDKGIDSSAKSGGNGPYIPDMNERLARLEGAFEQAIEGTRHGQNMLMGLAGIGFAIVIAMLVYVLQRIDNLPAEFERTNQTITSAITATKQQSPQVIFIPAPQAPQQPAPPPAPKRP